MTDYIAPLLNFASTASVALVAAVASYAVGRGAKRQEWKLNIRREKIAVRQSMYAAFLAEANRLVLLSLDAKSGQTSTFHHLFNKFAEIELLASEPV